MINWQKVDGTHEGHWGEKVVFVVTPCELEDVYLLSIFFNRRHQVEYCGLFDDVKDAKKIAERIVDCWT